MRALITGCAGFIGSHLCDALLDRGYTVTGIDDLSNGDKHNLFKSLQSYNFKFLRDDVTKLKHLGIFSEKFDYIFHLAALADIVPSIKDPAKYHGVNVDGTVNILQMAQNLSVKKFVYVASSSCYGLPKSFPTKETDPIDCRYPYALTKNVGEQYVMHWGRVYKLPVVSLRLFNVFGPRHRTSGAYGAAFGVFLAQIANGKPLTIVGDGTQKRDFTFVSDVVNALIMAAESNVTQEIFNVGSGGCYEVNRLADLLSAKDRVFIPKRPGEPEMTWADIEKINKLLKWSPKVSFESGVEIMKNEVANYKRAPLWDQGSIREATKDWFDRLS